MYKPSLINSQSSSFDFLPGLTCKNAVEIPITEPPYPLPVEATFASFAASILYKKVFNTPFSTIDFLYVATPSSSNGCLITALEQNGSSTILMFCAAIPF